jgi:hypothetical protein
MGEETNRLLKLLASCDFESFDVVDILTTMFLA